ncbi:receptor-like protein 9DC3 [Capsicum annuum]|uniref:receptor-like protein 9DC3 n=1 Tax=Capsicum annuum TaxID=4072 RepID=UPI001FB0A15D|nr:receptor-like protein 9DC3 [Capsicum annuum]
MSSLTFLDLSHNYFSHSVPSCLGNIGYIKVLNLRRNNFTGSLPPLCAQSTSLSTIALNGNRFEGTLPVSSFNCVGLEVLDLGNNTINDTFLAWLGTLEELQVLMLKSNEFPWTHNGSLPTEVLRNFKAMIKSDGMNKGKIKHMGPDVEGLTGDIPMELGKLNVLEALDLSWNRLTGKIPTELRRLKFLAVLNLSRNLLVGPIPRGLQFNTFENDSYGGNLDLCGPPLSKQCGTSDSSHLPHPLESEEEGESYFFSGFTWESVVIGYGFGLVVGTVAWNLMFKARKPKWLVEFFEGIFPKEMRRPKKRNHRRRT